MNKGMVVSLLLVLSFSGTVYAQDAMIGVEKEEVKPLLDTDPTAEKVPPKVTSVYGVSAEDYLLSAKKQHPYKAEVRRPKSRPAFDLPDAFFFFGGLALIGVLMAALVSFIQYFEELSQNEITEAVREHFNPQ